MRGTEPNRDGGGGSSRSDRGPISIYDSQAADDVIADRARARAGGSTPGAGIDPRSSQAADDVAAGIATGEISAEDITNMTDEARYMIPMSALPKAPKGKAWAEDRTLVDTDFWS